MAAAIGRKAEFGAENVATTVAASGVSMLFSPDMRYEAEPLMLAKRSHDHLTSLASTADPSANLAAGSIVNVNTVLSALASHLLASRPTIVLGSAGSTVMSVSYTAVLKI